MRTLEEVVNLETAPRVVQLRVLGGFAAVALLLAAIGIHGLLAFTVARGRAKSASASRSAPRPRDILWMVMGRSTTLAIIGVSIGAALAYAAGRSMQALLFGVDPADAHRLLRRGRAVAADGARGQPHPRLARDPGRSDDGDAGTRNIT